MEKPIGILGGTFDPIHFGHLRTALELYQALDLAEVRMIPCYQPMHRKQPIASPEQRLAMVKCAVESEPAFTVDACEIERKGPSYTIDTLEILRKQMPNTPLCLIMGIDALIGFSSWHRYKEILMIAHLVIAHRPNYQLPTHGSVAELLKAHVTKTANTLHQHLNGHILLHPVTALEISASDIRKQINTGKSVHYLMPSRVHRYIQEHGIYSINPL
jgi:nicotinate-nucleotide adenylyltransferase